MLAAAAVVATLLVGYPRTEDPNSQGPPAGPAHVLDARTLQRVPHSPELAAGSQVERSPDGRSLAAFEYDDDVLHFYDLATGDETGRITLEQAAGGTVLSWPVRNRILVVQCVGLPGDPQQCPQSQI